MRYCKLPLRFTQGYLHTFSHLTIEKNIICKHFHIWQLKKTLFANIFTFDNWKKNIICKHFHIWHLKKLYLVELRNSDTSKACDLYFTFMIFLLYTLYSVTQSYANIFWRDVVLDTLTMYLGMKTTFWTKWIYVAPLRANCVFTYKNNLSTKREKKM